MVMKISKILFVVLSAFCCVKASADLVWSADKGWRVEGGVLANVIGESSSVSNAIDAMNKARSAQEEKSFRSALAYYGIVIADYPESIFAPEALYQSAKIYLERGQFPDAYESVEQIIKQYPDYPKFKRVIGLEYKIASDMQEGRTYFINGWFPWFTSYADILKYYESVVANAPYGDYAPIA